MRSSGRDGNAGHDAQVRLRRALAEALRRRDAIAVSALRSALSAIGNAEAVTAPAATGTTTTTGTTSTTSAQIAGAAAGLGAGEIRRRGLSEAEVGQILEAEIGERVAAALDYESSGHPDRARRLRQEAHALRSAIADS